MLRHARPSTGSGFPHQLPALRGRIAFLYFCPDFASLLGEPSFLLVQQENRAFHELIHSLVRSTLDILLDHLYPGQDEVESSWPQLPQVPARQNHPALRSHSFTHHSRVRGSVILGSGLLDPSERCPHRNSFAAPEAPQISPKGSQREFDYRCHAL
jgi:hypothetical protein